MYNTNFILLTGKQNRFVFVTCSC